MKKFKSPNSNNKYALIAGRSKGKVQLGLSVHLEGIQAVLRFCVFSEGKPEMKNFNLRASIGQYANTEDATELLHGGQLDKVVIPVRDKKGMSGYISNMKEGEFARITEWVKTQVGKEGMEMCVTDEELASLFNVTNAEGCVFKIPDSLKAETKPTPVSDPELEEDEETY